MRSSHHSNRSHYRRRRFRSNQKRQMALVLRLHVARLFLLLTTLRWIGFA
jgi:hypothetical protein